jgi:Semialdehyde dehydrogenase, dimerisation domain
VTRRAEPENSRKLRIGLTEPAGFFARQVREVFRENSVPVSRFVPLGTPEEDGRLSELDGEAAVLQAPSRETIGDLDLLILAGSPADPECRVLAARLEIPVFDVEQTPAAAQGCAAILSASDPLPVVAAFTVLLPASEKGMGGIEELFAQAGDSLNFRPTQAPVFGSRLAFNLFRDAATASLEGSIRIALEERFSPCTISMLCARAGVFHGYAASARLQFATAAEANNATRQFAASPELSLSEAPGGASTATAVEDSRILFDPPIQAGSSVSIWFAFDGLALAARGALRAVSGLLR